MNKPIPGGEICRGYFILWITAEKRVHFNETLILPGGKTLAEEAV